MVLDFGVQIEPQYGYTYSHIQKVAREAERLGFESLWVSDHFLIRPEAVDVNCLECWTVLTAVSQDTENLRFGAMVTCQNYRNPALLANMAASLDHISGGRLYFGIGAGWKDVEYNAYNMPFPSPGKRIRQLDETLEIAKRMWTDPKASYYGKYYSVNDAASMPKPLQDPLPIVIGGSGNKTLRVSAKHAHAVNFAWNSPLGLWEEKLGVLEKHCEEVGRDFGEIRRSQGLHLGLKGVEARAPAPYEQYSGKRKWEYKSAEEAAQFIKGYMDYDVDHFVIVFPYGVEAESIRVFMDEVEPLL